MPALSRKCSHALSVPYSVSPRTRSQGNQRERHSEKDRDRKRERERETDRERKMQNMVALFLFLKGITGALVPFSYLVLYIKCIYSN